MLIFRNCNINFVCILLRLPTFLIPSTRPWSPGFLPVPQLNGPKGITEYIRSETRFLRSLTFVVPRVCFFEVVSGRGTLASWFFPVRSSVCFKFVIGGTKSVCGSFCDTGVGVGTVVSESFLSLPSDRRVRVGWGEEPVTVSFDSECKGASPWFSREGEDDPTTVSSGSPLRPESRDLL